MPPISPELAEFLALALEGTGSDDAPGICAFPNDKLLDEYMAGILERSEIEVNQLLEATLIPSTALGKDHVIYEQYVQAVSVDDSRSQEWLTAAKSDRQIQRIVNYYSGASDELPWEGIRWVINLVQKSPRTALSVIDAYFSALGLYFSDKMIHAISDAQAIVRARYIGTPQSSGSRLAALKDELSWREFEQLIQHLYDAMGYDTQLTPRSGDDGRDIVATRNEPGRRETLFVECKHYTKDPVKADKVSALAGRVSPHAAVKGVLVTTSRFAPAAIRFAESDHRIELIPGLQLIPLLNEYLGWTWPARLDRLRSQGPFRARDQDSET